MVKMVFLTTLSGDDIATLDNRFVSFNVDIDIVVVYRPVIRLIKDWWLISLWQIVFLVSVISFDNIVRKTPCRIYERILLQLFHKSFGVHNLILVA